MRVILHSDLNNFYASVECRKDPALCGVPLVVVGSKADRHGVVLAKNSLAKAAGVKTGDVYWQARSKCGNSLKEVTADFPAYIAVSAAVRKIYERYTPQVEAYGIDECWLDLGSGDLTRGVRVAEELRSIIRKELGLTVSVGVSWNKIFAKLGSDMKKPDAVTLISPDNYRTTAWRLPVEDLLYVGKATKKKLNALNVFTIGELAQTPLATLRAKLGKWGEYLHAFARGEDGSPVERLDVDGALSIGNSTTHYKDVTDPTEVRAIVTLLADTVAARMRQSGFIAAETVRVFARTSDLTSFCKQGKPLPPTGDAQAIASFGYNLLTKAVPQVPLRSIGIGVTDLLRTRRQCNLFTNESEQDRRQSFFLAVDRMRAKYGNRTLLPASAYIDPKLRQSDFVAEHTIHPYSYFKPQK